MQDKGSRAVSRAFKRHNNFMVAMDNRSTSSDSIQKKPVSFNNLAIGAALNIFEVSTLGQPFEVIFLG